MQVLNRFLFSEEKIYIVAIRTFSDIRPIICIKFAYHINVYVKMKHLSFRTRHSFYIHGR